MLLNALYLLALTLLSPWLLWRRVRTGRYRAGVTAKLLGRVTVENPQRKPVAWFHGVSVGEIHLLSTVVAAFRKRHPQPRHQPHRRHNAAANLVLVRRTAVTLLKQNPYKGSNKLKAYRASLRPAHLLELLLGSTVI